MSEPYSGELTPWQPAHLLRTYSLQEIRFSSGYLLGNYSKRFKPVLASWLPVFDLSQATLNNVESIPGFQFPGELDFLYVFKKGEEYGLIGIDGQSFRSIATLFLEADLFSDLSGEFVVEYLARKFIYSFAKSWNDIKESEISFYGLTDVGEIDIEGHLELRLELGGKNISVHLGLGPEMLQQLDYYLKDDGHGQKSQRGKKSLIRVGFQLDAKSAKDLEVGQAILMDQALSDPLVAILPDNRKFLGRIGQFNQRFAFESLGTPAKEQSAAIFVELAQADVDDMESITNPGFIFLSKTVVSKNATLIRENNLVADLSIYTVDNQFVLKKT
jgi:hypothetical protein